LTPSTHPLQGDELRMLRPLLKEHTGSPFVFVSERGGPMSTRNARAIVARAGEVAGLGFPVHPHQLRHACGYAIANSGDEGAAALARTSEHPAHFLVRVAGDHLRGESAMADFTVTWIDRGGEYPPNPAFPNGQDVDFTGEAGGGCLVQLAYPAKGFGYYLIRCGECTSAYVVTTAGRFDDPRSARIPCWMHTGGLAILESKGGAS
jgi:hypothetical protein